MKLATIPEISKTLRVCSATLYAKIRAGKIPSYKIGRKVLLDLDEVLMAIRQGGEK